MGRRGRWQTPGHRDRRGWDHGVSRAAVGLVAVNLAAFGAVAAIGAVVPSAISPRPSLAQAPSPNQPEAIPERRGLALPPCPRIGEPGAIQPLRIQPRQVGAKNARGCLSAEDAVYGPDGCPVRFCGTRTPRLQLPAP